MSQEDILKLITGASAIAKNTSKLMSNKAAEIIEENVLKGKYVSREEYNQLKKLVLKLERNLSEVNLKTKK